MIREKNLPGPQGKHEVLPGGAASGAAQSVHFVALAVLEIALAGHCEHNPLLTKLPGGQVKVSAKERRQLKHRTSLNTILPGVSELKVWKEVLVEVVAVGLLGNNVSQGSLRVLTTSCFVCSSKS